MQARQLNLCCFHFGYPGLSSNTNKKHFAAGARLTSWRARPPPPATCPALAAHPPDVGASGFVECGAVWVGVAGRQTETKTHSGAPHPNLQTNPGVAPKKTWLTLEGEQTFYKTHSVPLGHFRYGKWSTPRCKTSPDEFWEWTANLLVR